MAYIFLKNKINGVIEGMTIERNIENLAFQVENKTMFTYRFLKNKINGVIGGIS